MRQQLVQYVELLFAGAHGYEDIKQEILQNTLDRYDDLIAEGKVPEAAYRLAITGIGDISEILGTRSETVPGSRSVPETEQEPEDTPVKKAMRAVAIGLYIVCMLPLIVLSDMGMDTLGLCGTLFFVAIATVLIILGAKKDKEDPKEAPRPESPRQELRKSIRSVIWAVGLAVYFILSFSTGAWFVTWVIFPIIGAVQGLVKAILDLKEAG